MMKKDTKNHKWYPRNSWLVTADPQSIIFRISQRQPIIRVYQSIYFTIRFGQDHNLIKIKVK